MVGPSISALGRGQLHRVLELARRHLGMEIAYVGAFRGDRQECVAVVGDTERFGVSAGDSAPVAETYCARMVADESLSVIPDAGSEPRVRDLRATSEIPVGAYVGVPLRFSDGTLYGAFCCLSHSPDPTLTDRDAQFLEMLAELIVSDMEEERTRDASRAAVVDLLAGDSLQIALQPIVNLRDGRCVGVEALSRFPAELGSPEIVFTAAHDVGLGLDLEHLAVQSALELLPTLGPDQFLAVNMSPATARAIDLRDGQLPDGTSLDRLVIEITEHAQVAHYGDLRRALAPLRERGLRVAIDDAGAGFASLHHVVELAPDIIKVDRSLIHGIADDPVRRSVVSSFVLLGMELGAVVLAEGVETEDELDTARRLGVGAAQGYYFARPSTDSADHQRWRSDGAIAQPA